MHPRAALAAPLLLLPLLSVASAYESDTLTDRHLPLPDVTDILDARVNEAILDAIDRTNEQTACRARPEVAHRLLARAIHVRTATDELVRGRSGLTAFGFDRYSAWIEKGGVPRRGFEDRRDILAEVPSQEAPILTVAGVCSTVRVAGVLVGTDKLDHFFEEGYDGWRRSGFGEDFDAAVEWATFTELNRYGMRTSQAFSFADLRADFDGLEFYDTLLDPVAGVAAIDRYGCLEPTLPFSWRDRVTWEYDEVLNPPVYTDVALEGVARHLDLHEDEYCGSYEAWGGPAYEAHLADVLASIPPYAGLDAPPRNDPYGLARRCADWRADGETENWFDHLSKPALEWTHRRPIRREGGPHGPPVRRRPVPDRRPRRVLHRRPARGGARGRGGAAGLAPRRRCRRA